MKYYITVFISLLSFLLSGQSDLTKVAVSANIAREETFDITEVKYFNLQELGASNYKYYFRYKNVGQVVDVYSNDTLNFKGKLLNKIIELKTVQHDGLNESVPSNYVYEIVDVDTKEATEIGREILSKKIYNIPTDTLLRNWKSKFFDCSAIYLKYKVGDSLFKVDYGCPAGQDSTLDDYVKRVKNLKTLIDTSLKLEEKYERFTQKLEGGKSYTNEFYIVMFKLSSKMQKIWADAKPQRDYQASVKDIIDNYIKEKLREVYVKGSIDCPENNYYLDFSKQGKLKTISTKGSYWAHLFDKEYHQCRRKIRRLFKNISLEQLNLKYGFSREIDFHYDGTFSFSDPTIY